MSLEGTDAGLLAPGRAGSPAEAATGDTAFLQAMLDAEAALTRAQATVGLAPAKAATAVAEAARADRFDVRDIALRARSCGNPVIPLVADLTAAVPADAAPYVHRGATSQDIMDTAMMLVARRTLDLILADLTRTEAALALLAAEHRDTVMAGRTLTQHAVPTTFGLKAAGWRALVLDARDRARAVRDALPAQLGGAAGTLAAFGAYAGDSSPGVFPDAGDSPSEAVPDAGDSPSEAVPDAGDSPSEAVPDAGGSPSEATPDAGGLGESLVAAYARHLQLAEPTLPWHTLRTPVADLAAALAFTAGGLGKAATDILTLSRTELAELSEGAGGGSSAMPHKANPVRSTLIAAAARRSPGLAAALHASMAAEDERPAGAWHAEWEPLRDLLRTVGGASRHAAELTENLRVHPDAMREHLGLTHGLIVSERLTAELTPLLGRARAKELLTSAALRTRDEGRSLADVLAEEPGLSAVDLTELTDPTRYTGSAGALTDRALERR
ncbi:adenylosuccinate lyase family protein [Streptomyces sp. NPDC047525]|uniref:class-II fumarase/aspartase family protein n=1 Tax=Streptomyces sp. NPDC047525 TaxID=3155264 RepID=UPI0033D66AA8